jgi:L-seryl-tRNA(Ser) seleniumtransferase
MIRSMLECYLQTLSVVKDSSFRKKPTMSKDRRDSLHAVLRQLPSVEHLIAGDDFRALTEEFGRAEMVTATRLVLEDLRRLVVEGRIDGPEELRTALDSIAISVKARLEARTASTLIPLVNATGIILHTNLGRAPLSKPAIEALSRIASGYSSLELDLTNGKRGRRERHAAQPLTQLFPGFDALVVNNNAAAVLLVLNSFASEKEVIISRGELVEIGGSFRIPDILARSGARLREVGTTNKTRIADYEAALGRTTGAILRVHLSNFKMIGFTASATTEELVRLGRAHDLPVIEDFGSGNLLRLDPQGLPNEPTVKDSLEKGVDLVTFSGDKLLGGPQAGILIGSTERIDVCRKNPLTRALRVDKLTYSAIEATLSAYVKENATREIPVLQMLTASADEVRSRSLQFVTQAQTVEGLELSVVAGSSKVGGGAAPEEEIPTFLISVSSTHLSAQQMLDGLRAHQVPVIARIAEDRVLLDLRTVLADQEPILASALASLKKT